MKQKKVISIVMLCIFQLHSFAQYLPKSIIPYRIDICLNKTSNLIFPEAIKSVDRGSGTVLAQKAAGVENILQIKAGEPNLSPTNLTVITADGHFYSFSVSYASNPTTLNYCFVGDSSGKAMISDQPLAEASFTATANAIKSRRHSIQKSSWEQSIKLSLTNIFMKDDLLWLEIGIRNKSLIPFTPAYARFFLQDLKTTKRTATQQNELMALHHTPLSNVSAQSSQAYVFAFTPFTIPYAKDLIIQWGEREGSRLLTLYINHQTFRKIKALTETN